MTRETTLAFVHMVRSTLRSVGVLPAAISVAVGGAMAIGGLASTSSAAASTSASPMLGELGENWRCAGGTHGEHGDGHYDNLLEGWVVETPDGQHVEWGEGTDCNEVHSPAGPD